MVVESFEVRNPWTGELVLCRRGNEENNDVKMNDGWCFGTCPKCGLAMSFRFHATPVMHDRCFDELKVAGV